jgi:hypothetical protein
VPDLWPRGIIGGVGRFVPGVRLAGEFYRDVMRPLADAEFSGLLYAAALIGPGSEVLGFDTERSTDHDWGPRLLLFLGDEDADRLAGAVDEMLIRRLPDTFRGYPVAFGVTRDPGSGARHRVEVRGLGGWLSWRLGFDPRGGPITTGPTRSSTPGGSPPRCPARSTTRRSGGSRRPAPRIRSSTARPAWASCVTRRPSWPPAETRKTPSRYRIDTCRSRGLVVLRPKVGVSSG